MLRISCLVILALVATAVPGQSLDKVIPLGSVGSTMRYPWMAALDTASNRLFVADEEATEVLALDCTTHARVARLQLRECDWCLSLARGQASFALTIVEPSRVRLCVYDNAGREVARLHDGPAGPGRQSWTWSGTDASGQPVPAGVYYARADADGVDATARFVLVR